MKQVISYVAGAALVGWAAYILVATDPAVRTSRACMPLGGSVRIMGSVVRVLDEDTGRDLADEALPLIQTCRESVWYWANPELPLPDFNNQDAILGDYRPRGARDRLKETDKHPHSGPAQPASSAAAKPNDDERL